MEARQSLLVQQETKLPLNFFYVVVQPVVVITSAG